MRKLISTINAIATKDGDGVNISRIAGRHLNAMLDPFLMVDEINSDNAADYIRGFPEHPHRGFETISYMKGRRMRHRDHMGNEGVIEAGDVQWMTAGRGVLHSEMPEQNNGLLHGFQIWLNLPAAEKMKPAAYRDIRSADITKLKLPDGGHLQVIAGEVSVSGQQFIGPLPPRSIQPLLLDVQLCPHESVELTFKATNPALVYLYDGAINQSNDSNEKLLVRGQMGVYSHGEKLVLQAGVSKASMLVFSGQPLKEPIAQYGPFVMNSTAEIEQAIDDYRNNRLISD